MKPTLVVGIDPGLVHTGVVAMLFVPDPRKVVVHHWAVTGPNAALVNDCLDDLRYPASCRTEMYIEGYRPRSNFGTDTRMVEAVSNLKAQFRRSHVLNNTGVKKVIKKELMELLGVWKFSTATHHQDLRSAARIALLGMVKDEELNALVTAVVVDHLEGRDWDVEHR